MAYRPEKAFAMREANPVRSDRASQVRAEREAVSQAESGRSERSSGGLRGIFRRGRRAGVLFHVDDPARWKLTLVNVRNLLNDMEPGRVFVVVVANSVGVLTYVQGESSAIQEMEALSLEGVRFLACRNALLANGIEEKRLPSFVNVVPAGITEIVRLQMMGFAYVKP